MAIDLAAVGAKASAPSGSGVTATFGVLLPGIDPPYEVDVLVIHSGDRFSPTVRARSYPLSPTGGTYNLWRATVTIAPQAGTNFGASGRYLYSFRLSQPGPAGTSVVLTPSFTDPFARSTDDVGQLAAVATADSASGFSWHDPAWKVPEIGDLIVYELNVEEFNGTFAGVVDRLAYLQDLGVNCLELMPPTSLKLDFDWGYGPLYYFAPAERWGGLNGLQALIDACHQAGVAVIADMVFQHVDPTFPYAEVYSNAGLASPMIGPTGQFGPTIDYSQTFAQDYVQAVTSYWLETLHIDGFRYDEVTDLYDGPTGTAYAKIAYDAYDASLSLPRFTPSGGTASGEYSRVIQCPEALWLAQTVLTNTYSSAAWQEGLLSNAEAIASGGPVTDGFALELELDRNGYPRTKTVHDISSNPVDMPVAPFQYLTCHDKSHLMAWLTASVVAYLNGASDAYSPLADRSRWYKLQPLVVALMTTEGVPMLWQGEELGDNWVLAPAGDLRVHIPRETHWEYYYDDIGSALTGLYRTLGTLRRRTSALRSRDSFYFNEQSRPADGVIAYQRTTQPVGAAIVLLNFSDQPKEVTVPFPNAGTYREMVDDAYRATPYTIPVTSSQEPQTVTVPSNYGWIFVSP